MVAKISIGKSIYGALTYNAEKINKEKGRVLDTNKIYNDGSGRIDIKRAFEDFKRWMPPSTRTERPMMHISLNPHPDDVLSDTDFTRLAHEYMEIMGFADMPYLVVKHHDIERHHVHIVALRVGTDGRCISDKNNFYRSKEITRELEEKYGLKTAEREKITPDMPIRKIDPSGDIKRQVQNTVKMVGMRWKFQTLGEYNAVLSIYNIRCEAADGRVNGRVYHGLVYHATDDDGKTISTPLKASRLGKFASRTAIESRYEKAKDKIDIPTTKRSVADSMALSSDKDDFIARLKEKGIDLVLRYNDDGRLYGATYVDHHNHVSLNGSRLGKEFSANALHSWFIDPSAKPSVLPPPRHSESLQATYSDGEHIISASDSPQREHSQQTSQSPSAQQLQPISPPLSNVDYSNYTPPLPGLELFQTGPGFDPEEEAFARRMRKKKRKRGRGL